jgi:hypothetical protein
MDGKIQAEAGSSPPRIDRLRHGLPFPDNAIIRRDETTSPQHTPSPGLVRLHHARVCSGVIRGCRLAALARLIRFRGLALADLPRPLSKATLRICLADLTAGHAARFALSNAAPSQSSLVGIRS